MSSANFRVRRAVLDDLPTLRPIWESMRLNTPELERRLTEFQVVEDSHGKVIGGVAFQISGRHAFLHSEAFSDFSSADAARQLLWGRMQSLALNHGIARLWTRENSPFWRQNGFTPADADALKRLPAEFTAQTGAWLTLALKDEDTVVCMEKELALFMESEKQRTAQAFKQARALKTVATAIAIIFALFVAAAILYLLKKSAVR